MFLPAAVQSPLPTIEADELAWLAMQPDVESRLVFTERQNNGPSYRIEYGPFEESDLNGLPDADWTLLVQDVEKHLPDFRKYFELVPFIPGWRLDDLMVSVAAPGGSVGPHKDNYDVFLCQGSGARKWAISDDRHLPADTSAESLSLLMPFEPADERKCAEGDVLYVPPGIPHWGVAQTLCTTYSIGMRAPTNAELAAGCCRIFGADAMARNDGEIFYSDADLQSSESADGRIAADALQRLRAQKLLDPSFSHEQLATVLGSVVTDPKAWLDPDRPEQEDIEKALNGSSDFAVHGMTLITWYESVDGNIVFVNGSARGIPATATDLVRQLCLHRSAPAAVVKIVLQDEPGEKFIRWMLSHGLLDMGDNAP